MQIYILNPMPFDGLGPSQTCLKIADEMSRAGHDVFIFGARHKMDINKDITFHTPFSNIGKYLPYRYMKNFFDLWLHRSITKRIPENSIVYAWPSTQHSTLEKLKKKGCKIFVETINLHTLTEKKIIEHEMKVESFFYTHYVTEEKINNQIKSHEISDCVFVSNEHAFHSVSDAGVPYERICLTRYGGDKPDAGPGIKRELTSNGNRFVFLFVGRINMEKGVHKLLKAWRLANVDAELHLYGNADKNMIEKYQTLFDQKGVKMMEYTNDIHKVYASSDAFIFLSLAEGGPLVSIEAALHKLPMIVSSRGGGRISKHNETALIVDPDDTKSVAHAIEQILTNRVLREKLGTVAHTIAVEEFTWEKAAKERLECIQGLCA